MYYHARHILYFFLFFSLQHNELPFFWYASTFQHSVVLNRVGTVAASQARPTDLQMICRRGDRAPPGPRRGAEEPQWSPSLQGQGLGLQLSGSTSDPVGGQGDRRALFKPLQCVKAKQLWEKEPTQNRVHRGLSAWPFSRRIHQGP